jgi:hypothetical protein
LLSTNRLPIASLRRRAHGMLGDPAQCFDYTMVLRRYHGAIAVRAGL